MSSLLQNAKTELRAAGLYDEDADYNGLVAFNALSMLEVFVAGGHSGGSAELTLAVFDKLARHKPLTPLTGEDDEWEDRSEMSGFPLWQNLRAHNVFKNEDRAWTVSDDKTVTYITFPYTVE